ncbi:MAG TPA: hypothetical protein VEA38_04145 [Terriglobales bacterium]|nr:hypothetical protein [Terriglobales bacterium]
MAKFVRLTLWDGRPQWVNPAQVVTVAAVMPRSDGQPRVRLTFATVSQDGGHTEPVCEEYIGTPERVVALLEGRDVPPAHGIDPAYEAALDAARDGVAS